MEEASRTRMRSSDVIATQGALAESATTPRSADPVAQLQQVLSGENARLWRPYRTIKNCLPSYRRHWNLRSGLRKGTRSTR